MPTYNWLVHFRLLRPVNQLDRELLTMEKTSNGVNAELSSNDVVGTQQIYSVCSIYVPLRGRIYPNYFFL